MRGGAARRFASDRQFHRGIQAESTWWNPAEQVLLYQCLTESRPWRAGFFCGSQGIHFVEATRAGIHPAEARAFGVLCGDCMWLEEPLGNLAAEACQTRAEAIRLDLAASRLGFCERLITENVHVHQSHLGAEALPCWHAAARRLRAGRAGDPGGRARRAFGPHALAVGRSLHACPPEPGEELCRRTEDRRDDDGRRRGRGDRLGVLRFSPGRHRHGR